MMDIILFILGLVLCLIGITGSFVPMIPGPFVSWLAILILNLTDAVEFNLNFVLITLSVAVAVGFIDYLIPIIGVKKLGGSKSGQVGTFIGLVLAKCYGSTTPLNVVQATLKALKEMESPMCI